MWLSVRRRIRNCNNNHHSLQGTSIYIGSTMRLYNEHVEWARCEQPNSLWICDNWSMATLAILIIESLRTNTFWRPVADATIRFRHVSHQRNIQICKMNKANNANRHSLSVIFVSRHRTYVFQRSKSVFERMLLAQWLVNVIAWMNVLLLAPVFFLLLFICMSIWHDKVNIQPIGQFDYNLLNYLSVEQCDYSLRVKSFSTKTEWNTTHLRDQFSFCATYIHYYRSNDVL